MTRVDVYIYVCMHTVAYFPERERVCVFGSILAWMDTTRDDADMNTSRLPTYRLLAEVESTQQAHAHAVEQLAYCKHVFAVDKAELDRKVADLEETVRTWEGKAADLEKRLEDRVKEHDTVVDKLKVVEGTHAELVRRVQNDG